MTLNNEIKADFLITTTHLFQLDESDRLVESEKPYGDYIMDSLKKIFPTHKDISIYSGTNNVHVTALLDDKAELDLKKAEIEQLKDIEKVHYEFHKLITSGVADTIQIYDQVKATKEDFEKANKITAQRMEINIYKLTARPNSSQIIVNGDRNTINMHNHEYDKEISKSVTEQAQFESTIQKLVHELSKNKAILQQIGISAISALIVEALDFIFSSLRSY
jgi:hypothetical protein